MAGKRDEALRVGHAGETRLDSDSASMKKVDDRRCIRFRQIHRGVVRQFGPAGDCTAGALLVVFDPSPRRHSDERARAGKANGANGCVHGLQALLPARPTGMKVEFARTEIDTGGPIQGHSLRRQRKSGMKVVRACAVEASLDDHIASGRDEERYREPRTVRFSRRPSDLPRTLSCSFSCAIIAMTRHDQSTNDSDIDNRYSSQYQANTLVKSASNNH